MPCARKPRDRNLQDKSETCQFQNQEQPASPDLAPGDFNSYRSRVIARRFQCLDLYEIHTGAVQSGLICLGAGTGEGLRRRWRLPRVSGQLDSGAGIEDLRRRCNAVSESFRGNQPCFTAFRKFHVKILPGPSLKNVSVCLHRVDQHVFYWHMY